MSRQGWSDDIYLCLAGPLWARNPEDSLQARLRPASAISQARIPCVIWAEDVLGVSFVHFVPTSLFTLQLFVPDKSLEATAVTPLLPYQRLSTPLPYWNELPFIEPATPNCFPNFIALALCTVADRELKDVSKDVLLHPQSYFSYPVSNHDLSMLLDDFPSNIRFPTLISFLDSLITTILDPPLGFRHQKLHLSLMTYLSYLVTYTLRNQPRVQPNGEIEAEHASVLSNLEENKPFSRMSYATRPKGGPPRPKHAEKF